jgi:hypothetical protein
MAALDRASWEGDVAKGQVRSNKEKRKPKADKKAKGLPAASESAKSGANWKPLSDKKKG